MYIYLTRHYERPGSGGGAEQNGGGRGGSGFRLITPSPPTKSFDFRGFDSSKLLMLKGGNSHVRGILWGVSRKV